MSFSHTLISLSLFGCCNIFYEEENPGGCEDDCLVNPTRQVLVKDFTFEGFSRLRFLNLGRLMEGVNVESLLRPLASLAALDLSGIQLGDVGFLTQWKDTLVSLVLYNMDLSEEHIQVIAQLHKLRSAAGLFPAHPFPTDGEGSSGSALLACCQEATRGWFQVVNLATNSSVSDIPLGNAPPPDIQTSQTQPPPPGSSAQCS